MNLLCVVHEKRLNFFANRVPGERTGVHARYRNAAYCMVVVAMDVLRMRDSRNHGELNPPTMEVA